MRWGKKHREDVVPTRVDPGDVLRVLRETGTGEGAAIFDLDGTLLDNIPRQLEIYRQLRTEGDFPVPLPDIEPLLTGNEYSILSHLPTAGAIPGKVLSGVKRAFLSRFLANDYLRYDRPFPGAPKFVNSVLDMGYSVVYVTGRHHESETVSMRDGTLESLARFGFPTPDGDDVRLVMKPKVAEKDLEFKVRVFTNWGEYSPAAPRVAFENDVEYCELLVKYFPRALVVRYKGAQRLERPFSGPVLSSWS
ncbi:MAG: HAD family hydrolase [Promethearchaeota archaeon]